MKTDGNSSLNFSIDNDMTLNVKDLYLLNIQKLVKTIERLKNNKNFLGSNHKEDEFEKTRLVNQTGVDLYIKFKMQNKTLKMLDEKYQKLYQEYDLKITNKKFYDIPSFIFEEETCLTLTF